MDIKKTSSIGIVAAAVFALAQAAGAAVMVGNTADSGMQPGSSSNNSFSFDNNGSVLAVVVTAGGGMNGDVDATVTYNNVPLIQAREQQDRGWAAIYYLTTPATGPNSLEVTLTSTAGDPITDGAGDWQYGALSLNNVDTSDPIALADGFDGGGTNTFTLLSPSPGDISAGDLLVSASFSRNDKLGNPNWTTPDGAIVATEFYRTASAGNSGNGGYNAEYELLTANDLSDEDAMSSLDDVVLSETNKDAGAYSMVVFNEIPEPATVALLGLGSLLIVRRK